MNQLLQVNYKHSNQYSAITERIKLVRGLIDFTKKKCKWRKLFLEIVRGMNPQRPDYDYVAAGIIYSHLKTRVPFRKDIVGVETIQIPDITYKLGGDCDCMAALAGSILESGGIPVRIGISMQSGAEYDHLFLVIENKFIFDLTFPGGFPAPINFYKGLRII